MRKKRILVVDDEPDITLLVRISLEQSGEFEVMEETDASQVLALARQFKPDLILCDILMPVLDGGDIAALLKTDPQLSGTPVIFLTATVLQEEVDEQGGIIGGHPFLAKPVETKAMIACIHKNTEGVALQENG